MTRKPTPETATGSAPDAGAAGRLQQSVATVIVLAAACWIAFVSFDVEDPQPYLFPQLFSGIMAVLALIVALRAVRGVDRTAAGIGGRTFRNIAPGLAVMLIYVFGLAEWLGFYTAAFLAMFVLYSLYDPSLHRRVRSWAVRLAVTAGFIAVIYAVFAQGLKVHTPEGALF
jgi:hypothetical protein